MALDSLRAAYDAEAAASARCAAALAQAPFRASLVGFEGVPVFVGLTLIEGEAVTYARVVDQEALEDRPERVIAGEIRAALKTWRERR